MLGLSNSISIGRGGKGPSSLLNGLVSYWTLDETSGTRYDSKGSNHLTDVNAVGYAAGKHNNAASFVTASSQKLVKAAWDWTAYYASGFSVSFWYNFTGEQYDALSRDDSSSVREFVFSRTNEFGAHTPYTTFFLSHRATATSSDGGDGTWNHIIFTYDPVDQKVRIYLNGGTAGVSTAITETPGSVAFDVGARSSSATYITGLIDELVLWSRVLTADERTELWNGGVGSFWPFS